MPACADTPPRHRRVAIWASALVVLAVPAAAVEAAPVDASDGGSALHAMGSWADERPSTRATSDGQASSWDEQGVAGRRGVDVSYWDHQGASPLDFSKMARVGVEFVFIKASEFTSGREGYQKYSHYDSDRAAAKAAGLITGAYQYANPTSDASRIDEDAAAQARGLVDRIGSVEAGELPPVLDLENTKTKLGPANLSRWAETWLGTAHQLTGRQPILYTYTNYLATKLRATAGLTKYPLWQAHYNYRLREPTLVTGWPRELRMFWQFSSKGRPPGTGGSYTDLDVFLGTDTDYERLIGSRAAPSPQAPPQSRPPQRSHSAAQASLERIEKALRRIALRRGIQYSSRAFTTRIRAKLRARGVTRSDIRFGGQYRLGRRRTDRVWLRQTFVGGDICSVAAAPGVGNTWSRVPCPRATEIWKAF